MRADPVIAALAAVTAIAVIDGDTVHVGAERYRLLGIDAAEIRHAQCDAERRLGVLTKKRLEALLGTGAAELRPQNPKRDKYGRLLVHLFVNGEDASCVLIREGYARPWAGRRDWCIKTAPLKTTEGIDCAIAAPRP
jgi:endonuclease YncB( thermonuclease family)